MLASRCVHHAMLWADDWDLSVYVGGVDAVVPIAASVACAGIAKKSSDAFCGDRGGIGSTLVSGAFVASTPLAVAPGRLQKSAVVGAYDQDRLSGVDVLDSGVVVSSSVRPLGLY